MHGAARLECRLEARDLTGYRKDCTAMIAGFIKGKAKTVPADRGKIAWHCVLIPNAVDDLNQVLALADQAVAAKRSYAAVNTQAAALYRAGRYEESLQRLKESTGLSEDKRGTPYDWLFEAMAAHKLGRKADAATSVKKSDAWIAKMEQRVARRILQIKERSRFTVVTSDY